MDSRASAASDWAWQSDCSLGLVVTKGQARDPPGLLPTAVALKWGVEGWVQRLHRVMASETWRVEGGHVCHPALPR